MTTDRYERGLARLKEIDSGSAARITERLKDTAPDLARYIIEFVFGEIYTRPGLDLKLREIVTVTATATLGYASRELKAHINFALNVGCSRQEIVECLLQIAVYAGFPAALNAISVAREVFLERDAQAGAAR